ncbi:hypothetical protein JD969_13635 [Planctomycetota bacterium]|nr:hypothetical protein JD969_13635 [Planctomycetota bacterium]
MPIVSLVIFILGFAFLAIGATLLTFGLSSYCFNSIWNTVAQHSKIPIRGKGILIGSFILFLGFVALAISALLNI